MILVVALLLLVAVTGLGVVLTREPRRQVLAIAANGLVMGLLFLALQAPDVAYSQIVIGSAIQPLLFMVTLASLRTTRSDK
ncbi:hypothetical protein Rumeso_00672 [Rubellimicrobium mesophilum DSM 19309]|uniref:MrpA C-terminal/MbhD domain-containing protein n=1 Tax=Rubellimicrobium mesophilum DSM 19309 TaxID=442562 RepID=A0A017HVD3_9RHOB|nr:DUF4040 domain-containing protein [Rubellimicrobium mesophilum]EYD77714.1 hypothetical protein Rumeso_00672 [Rubellimicrobium mesophilum DSM 19309]